MNIWAWGQLKFVEESIEIPAHIREQAVIVRSEAECAQENSDVAEDTPKTLRKCRASNVSLLEMWM